MNNNNNSKIALFVGNDISSIMLICRLVPKMLKERYVPILVFPENRKLLQINKLNNLAFYERKFLNEIIFPFLDKCNNSDRHHVFITPKQIKIAYGIEVLDIENINDLSFIKYLRKNNINKGISIRCYQKFNKEFIQEFTQNEMNFLWNLHPAKLPTFRGVMPMFRVMQQKHEYGNFTLHKIDENFDTGEILDYLTHPFDYNKSMLTNMIITYPQADDFLMKNIKTHFKKGILSKKQNNQYGRYYSYPSQMELEKFENQKIKLYDKNEIKDIYIEKFLNNKENHWHEINKYFNLKK